MTVYAHYYLNGTHITASTEFLCMSVMCVYVYVCACVFMNVCVCVCVCCVHVYYVCICVYVCVFCSFLAELITTVLTVSWSHSQELLYITSHYTQLCAPKISCYCCSSRSSTTTTFDTLYTGVLG